MRDEAVGDLRDDVRAANALVDRIAARQVDGEMRALTSPQDPVTALLRADTPDVRERIARAGCIGQSRSRRTAPLGRPLSPLPPQAGAAFAMPEPLDASDMAAPMAPGEVRVLAYAASDNVVRPASCPSIPDPLRTAATRIAIEAVAPTCRTAILR